MSAAAAATARWRSTTSRASAADVTRVELTTFSEPATMVDRLKEIGAAGWMRRKTRKALDRLRMIFEEPHAGGARSGRRSRATSPRRRPGSVPTAGMDPARRAAALRAALDMPARMPRRLLIAALPRRPRAPAPRACGEQRHGAGGRRARSRGPRARAGRRRLQRLHHARAEPEDHARQGLRRPAGGAADGADALRRVPPGVQPLEGPAHRTANDVHDHRQPGQRVRAGAAAGGQRTSPTSRGRSRPNECIPEAGSVAQLGPTAGSMLLFRLPLENTENRPLELEIEGPERRAPHLRRSTSRECGVQHHARGRRGRRAAGARSHEHHRDRRSSGWAAGA